VRQRVKEGKMGAGERKGGGSTFLTTLTAKPLTISATLHHVYDRMLFVKVSERIQFQLVSER
jgi:hypothetical protein